MAKSDSKTSSFLSYLWSILMIVCILLLTVHLVLSTKEISGGSPQTIENTFTSRK